MAYSLTVHWSRAKVSKNCCEWTVLVQLLVKDVVTGV